MSDDLEDLARRGRGTRDKRDLAARKAEKRNQKPRRNHLLLRSARPAWLMILFFVLFTGGGSALLLSLEHNVWLQLAALLAGVALIMGVLRVVDDLSYRLLVGWLTTLPFEIDAQQYERVLGTGHGSRTTVTVRISFERAPAEPTKQTISDAVLGSSSKSEVTFDGDLLVVKSHSLKTSSRTESGSKSNNSGIHQWFKKLASRALVVVHRSHPIARVEVDAF